MNIRSVLNVIVIMVVFDQLQKFPHHHPVLCMTIIYALSFSKSAQKRLIKSLWKLVFIHQKLLEIKLVLVFLSRAGGSSAVEQLLSMHKAQGSIPSTAQNIILSKEMQDFQRQSQWDNPPRTSWELESVL